MTPIRQAQLPFHCRRISSLSGVLLFAALLQACASSTPPATDPALQADTSGENTVQTGATGAASNAVPLESTPDTSAASPEIAATDEAAEPQVEEEAPPPPIEYGRIEEDALTASIMAELAIQRGRNEEALDIYTSLARETGNISFIQRAMRLAIFVRNAPVALEFGELWLEREPESHDVRQMLALQLVLTSRYAEALKHMSQLLEQDEDPDFRLIPSRLQNDPSAPLLLEAMIDSYLELKARFPESQTLPLGLAMLYEQNEEYAEALAIMIAVNAEGEFVPEFVMKEIGLLEELGETEQARKRLEQSLATNPEHKQLRFMYGRKLIAERQYQAAREQFSIMVEQDPDDMDMLYSLALLSMEVQMYDEARGYWQRLLVNGQHRDEAHFYLGFIAEQGDNADTAIRHYLQVEGGNNFVLALRNLSQLMIEAGRYPEAHAHLQNVRFRHAEYNLPLLSVEAALLTDMGYYEEAQALLDGAISDAPNNIQLLFQRSVLFTEQDRLGEMERDLRRIIRLDPDSPMAYNSLGYYLADRTDRYQEAYELILKASALAPNDPAIIDSLGWAQYRLGMFEQALANLERAYQLFPDPEVAAHLGEVLWVMGRKSAANRVWNEALKTTPDSEFILNAMERLKPGATR
ncbi:MAG TPA: tetratricopeptide repeat protein [Pseudomonadaceae bacterium]|nr:tetratricopeptide repeat protein [Pseudomonadaceae bacterium]